MLSPDKAEPSSGAKVSRTKPFRSPKCYSWIQIEYRICDLDTIMESTYKRATSKPTPGARTAMAKPAITTPKTF